MILLQEGEMIDPFCSRFFRSADNENELVTARLISLWETFKVVFPSTGVAPVGLGRELKR